MPRIVFVEANGTRREVESRVGQTLMEVARDNDIEGILAECGGACACATCHVRVDEKWFAVTGPPAETEASMLEFSQSPGPTSRLSCQITLSDDLDGLVVYIPDAQ
jgi:2Fe-2S ferredoxin